MCCVGICFIIFTYTFCNMCWWCFTCNTRSLVHYMMSWADCVIHTLHFRDENARWWSDTNDASHRTSTAACWGLTKQRHGTADARTTLSMSELWRLVRVWIGRLRWQKARSQLNRSPRFMWLKRKPHTQCSQRPRHKQPPIQSHNHNLRWRRRQRIYIYVCKKYTLWSKSLSVTTTT